MVLGVLWWWAPAGSGAQDRMPANEAVATLRRLYQSGDRAGAEALLDRLAAQARGDANYCFAVGMTLGAAGQIGRAEQFLTMAAAAAPADYRILYNLGVAASYSGHFERAQEVLATALKLQPQNVDVLYNLAYVNEKLGRREETIRLLARAVKLAPQRADLYKLTAIAAFELRAWEDALAAWNSYLKLQPDDDVARRERGFTAVQMGQFEQGIADIKRFLERHPRDAEAYHELGLAEVDIDPEQALANLDKAIELQPDFPEARSNRGNLSYQQGRPEAALPDLEFAAKRKPDDAITLDRLGQTYLALDRPADAVRVLRRAAGLAPDDGRTLLHLGRALADAGEVEESKNVMERFRQMGPTKSPPVPAGLVDYLGLSPEQQRADYRSRLEKAIAKEPGDAAAQVRYLKFLLEEGDVTKARTTARQIAELKPNGAVLAEAGRALLAARQFQAARDLLAQAGESDEVRLDLALATFGVSGGAKGLEELDRVPESGRTGGYYLARAQMLDATGKAEEARVALRQALEAASGNPQIYARSAALLLKNGRTAEAMPVLERAAAALAGSREIQLLRATTLELAGNTAEAERRITEVLARWPEWHAGWVAQGIMLASRKRYDDARMALETAVKLGAHSAETYYYLADCVLRSSPERRALAESAIQKALTAAPSDPYIQALAARVAKRDAREPAGAPPFRDRLFQSKPPAEW